MRTKAGSRFVLKIYLVQFPFSPCNGPAATLTQSQNFLHELKFVVIGHATSFMIKVPVVPVTVHSTPIQCTRTVIPIISASPQPRERLHLQKRVIIIIIAAVFGAEDITRHDIVNKILQFPFLQQATGHDRARYHAPPSPKDFTFPKTAA
jgi:hypothetical protein